jgi:hypothetical protein
MLYRGKKFRLTAEVAADVAGKPNAAKLLARVHTDSGGTSFRDDMGENPIAVSNWSRYEINGEVSPAARDMEFGVQLIGPGRAFVRAVSLQFMD